MIVRYLSCLCLNLVTSSHMKDKIFRVEFGSVDVQCCSVTPVINNAYTCILVKWKIMGFKVYNVN